MWKFKELTLGEPEREPHEAEFFRLTDPAEAVVREFIQNSLDARRAGASEVLVRFTLGSVEKRLVRSYFDDLMPHLQACNLRPSEYESSDTIPFLTIEDFGTTGLDGPTVEDGRRPVERSNFYNFWWCEGKSLKSDRDAGRWGLGKTAFHITSKLRSFWGLTVRQDDSQELLMGKALLKPHRFHNSVYHYYGYFTDDNYRPVREREFIQQFKRKFGISRGNETGVSLVIPVPDEEITSSRLLKSAIMHYFYPIIKGYLKVEIGEPGNAVNLDANNLIDIALRQNWQGTLWESVDAGELLQFIKNSIHATDIIEVRITEDESLQITENSAGDRIDELKTSFNACFPLRFKIPVKIRTNNGETDSYFEVYLKKHQQLTRAEEFYIRSGIRIIPRTMILGNRPVFAVLVAEDTSVATFLGDAENPAHTEWNERTEGFRDKYQNAARILRFIKKSPGQIVSILDQPPQERQKDFLKEIFFIPERLPEEEEDREVTKPPDIPPDIPRRPALFNIQQISTGFQVTLKRTNIDLPLKARIMVAYDVRRGNPFSQYDPEDFDLEGQQISINATGCNILSRDKNRIVLEVTAPDFNLEVTGFDPNRDIVVDIKEEQNEAQV